MTAVGEMGSVGVPERVPLEKDIQGGMESASTTTMASGSGWVISGFHDHGMRSVAGGGGILTKSGRTS